MAKSTKKAESAKTQESQKSKTAVKKTPQMKKTSQEAVKLKKKTAPKATVIRQEKRAGKRGGQPSPKRPCFHIVGIGASAGGLDAIEKFLRHMPSDSDMAFVLVPHLDPDHKSMMGDLLKRFTKMDIFQAEEGMTVRPNFIYIIPPNREMAMREGKLRLFELKEPRGVRHPIDFFFRSLADDKDECAIGIVLSGTGTEGALGLRAIKGAGGLALVQDPATASYGGMPESSISTGIVDYVLPPEKMAETLLNYIKQSGKTFVPPPGKEEEEEEEPRKLIHKVIGIVRDQTGVDFSLYKTNTIIRRVEKRMAMHQIQSMEEYLTYLRSSPHEVGALQKEILIRVTNFFRDPEAFDILKSQVLAAMIEAKTDDAPLRIWVPGCSTGEEAYSIAIIVRELMEQSHKTSRVQIFATDIDTGAIEIARAGIYADSITADISPDRLSRYFVKHGQTYKIRGELREMVVFAVHNILKDPPFLNLDLISCRNVLIYMGSELQKKVIPLMRYALNPGGVLLLGTSENIGEFTDLFTVVDKRWKIFRARHGERIVPTGIGMRPAVHHWETPKGEARPEGGDRLPEVSLTELTENVLLREYTPSSVVVNEQGEVLYFHGRTGKYLEPPSGRASLKILDMVKEGLKLELMSGLRKALARKEKICSRGLQVRTNGGIETVDMDIRYIHEPQYLEGLVMVVFKPVPQPKQEKAKTGSSREAERLSKHVAELEYELKSKEERLQTTIEELETSNEELKSANEELQSSNEELQSMNEELETSREELQSVNEELVTVNSEYQDKIDELSRTQTDMNNLLASTRIATIFVDGRLSIKRFTPSAAEVINLIDSDVGRPLTDISSRVEYPHLVADAKEVIKSLEPKKKMIKHQGGGWYLAKILPYRREDNVIDGAVITFVDITEQKKAEEALQSARTFQGVVQSIREAILLLDANLNVEFANNAFYDTFRTSSKETVKNSVYGLGNGQWNIPSLRRLLENVLPEKKRISGYVVEHDFPEIGRKKMLLDANIMFRDRKEAERILLTINDITGEARGKKG